MDASAFFITIMILCTSIPQGKLFYYPLGQGEDSVLVINADTLQEETSLDLDGSDTVHSAASPTNCTYTTVCLSVDCLGSQCLFSDGECIGQIKVKKEVCTIAITLVLRNV